ncbi:MAG: hypothetical protein J7K69_08470 [Thermotogae bacterium]|nr:hypothetical protein [Thermotogota bacterium]
MADKDKSNSDRVGFLKMKTNLFDRIFISVILFVAINLLWMRFLEQYMSIYFAVILSFILGFIIVKWG